MDVHLATIASALDSIGRLHVKSAATPRPFTSAVLNTQRLDVLDFIRDADPFESNLFSREPEGEAGPSDITLGRRQPERRAYVPPTPLRKQAKDAEARGLVEFDARTLLKAAQRLLDNYHNAPRARKHIKALLRKHTELQRTISGLNESVSQTADLLAELAASLRTDPPAAKMADEREAKALQEQIRREEMEIVAIEQTMEELQGQREKQAMANRSETSPSKTRKRQSVPQRVSPQKTPTRRPEKVPSPQPTMTPTTPTPTKPGEYEEPVRQSSDELERICRVIWTIFGDNLRHVAPDREAVDYFGTLRALQDLSLASTSSYTTAISARVLVILLSTPAPHVMDFDALKREAEAWWEAEGQLACKADAFPHAGPAQAGKAVYELIAKKLLRLRFSGAQRIVSFPPNTV